MHRGAGISWYKAARGADYLDAMKKEDLALPAVLGQKLAVMAAMLN